MTGWEPPAPLGEFALPPFPADVFPPWLRLYARALARATQTPIDLPAMLILAALAVACARKLVVRVKEGYREPLNIYTVTAQPPAARKTAVFREVTRPIEEYERELAKEVLPQIAAARTQLKIAERQLEERQRNAARADGPEAQEACQQAEALARQIAEMKVPSVPRLIASDATPESLTSLLAEFRRMSLMTPEGGPFGMMGGRYRASRQSPNVEVYLKGHAGDDMRVDRKARAPEFIDRPALTIGLAVQPEIIRGLAENPGFRGIGLYARFLYAMPPSLVGRRQIDPPPVPEAVAGDYRTRMRALLGLPAGTDEDGEPAEHVLTLSADALRRWLDFAGWVEPQLADLGPMAHMSDWGGKLPGAVARIAGLLHAADLAGVQPPWAVPIPAATVERAVAVGEYLIPHARAAFFEMGADPAIADAWYVLAWIGKHGGGFTRRDCFEGTKGRFKQVEGLEPALGLLEKHGYIRRRPAPARPGRGRPPGPGYDVNPATFREEFPTPRSIQATAKEDDAPAQDQDEVPAEDSAGSVGDDPPAQEPPGDDPGEYEEMTF